jgi:U2 small nuclear ribonucleoprotein A'
MRRLSTLFLSNNYIFRIGNLGGNLSNLSTLVLTNNRITNLSEIDNLASLTQLELLSLMDNPLTNHVHYRLYVIHKIPSLKCLDFQKVTREEREQSRRLFASQEGADVLSAMEREKTNEVPTTETVTPATFSDKQREYIRAAIEATQTKEEMNRIEHQLRVSRSSCSHLHHDLHLFISRVPFLFHLKSTALESSSSAAVHFVSNQSNSTEDPSPGRGKGGGEE